MAKLLTLDDLQKQFDRSREKLSLERREILSMAPLPDDFSRDTYGFSYIRAERAGLDVVTHFLEKISWLPMRIDPQAEIVSESKKAMKKWLSSTATKQPDSTVFGNDFVHTLTRVALVYGWESPQFHWASLRIGQLFHDLSCLIGLIYYGVWMAENGIVGVPVSDPYDLGRTAKEIAALSQSPEVAQLIAERKQALEKEQGKTKKKGPSFRVIKNEEWPGDSPTPLT